ncbi:MAG: restriction endonuclease, partial [Clostridiales bacterium]|nr:restriction endonuclease [Clostridiales bacterium]
GCFDDPTKTFADLYMKSGLYITEIVKRLFRSEKMKEIYPNDGDRIRHILREQVYGMAPTRIIYLIATNYILGFDETLKQEILEGDMAHFVEADTAEAAKADRLEELVKQYFG